MRFTSKRRWNLGALSRAEYLALDALLARSARWDDDECCIGFDLVALTADEQGTLATLCVKARARFFDEARGRWWPRQD